MVMLKGIFVHSFITLALVLVVEGARKEERCKNPPPFALEACAHTKNIPEFPMKAI
jgi:hypothetical protein